MLNNRKSTEIHTINAARVMKSMKTSQTIKTSKTATMTKLAAALFLLCSASISVAENRTLLNLERERSSLVDIITDEQLGPNEREQKIIISQRRLMDMERMVIRDDRLLGSKDPMVKKAFDHYDTTFLVHASAEANLHIVDFWLQQLQLDSKGVLSSKRGRR